MEYDFAKLCTKLVLFIAAFLATVIVSTNFYNITEIVYAQVGGLGNPLQEGLGNIFGGYRESVDTEISKNISSSQPYYLVTSSVFVTPPVSSAVGNNVYVVWGEYSLNGSGSILLRASNDNGKSFGQPILIDKVKGTTLPILAISERNIYVVWTNQTTDGRSIILRASNDNGTSFNTPVSLGNNISQFFTPVVAASGNNVYIAWLDELSGNSHIDLAASRDSGLTFKRSTLVNSRSILEPPGIAASGDNVYVVWSETVPGDSRVFFKVSDDKAETFEDSFNIVNKSRFTYPPILETSGNNVYVVWQDGEPDNLNTKLITSHDNGFNFNQPIILAQETGPDILLVSGSGNNVYVAWTDSSLQGRNALVLRSSNNNGTLFGDANIIANNIQLKNSPTLDSSKDSVYLTWSNNSGLFLRGSNNAGNNFNNTVLYYASDIGEEGLKFPAFPSISIINDYLYLFWEEFSISPTNVTNSILFEPLALASSGAVSIGTENASSLDVQNYERLLKTYERCLRSIERLNDLGANPPLSTDRCGEPPKPPAATTS